MRILLLGANGQIGHALRQRLPALGELIPATRTGLAIDGVATEAADLEQPEALRALLRRLAPDVVVNAAAYTAVDRAEDEPALAHAVNALAPAALARECAALGARLLHYSTDYVFDGRASRPYREDDATGPINVYGASKLAGEQAVLAAGGDALVLRTAWVYGRHGHNFLNTMLRLAARQDAVRVVADQFGTPTPAALVATITAELLQSAPDARGVLHLTAGGSTHWHGFAEAIMALAHRDGLLARRPEVIPVGSQDWPTRARRPACSRLDTGRLEQRLGRAMPDWRDELERELGRITT